MAEKYYVEVDDDGTRWYAWPGTDRGLHRLDGPTIEHSNGRRDWYQNEVLHRTDGPAVVNYNDVGFWIDGHRCTESDYCARTGYVATQGGGMYDTVV